MKLLMKLAAMMVVAIAAGAAQAEAQGKAVRMVVAFPPGGPVDLVGRILADQMTKDLGHPVIIENKGGANGAIGAEYVARGPADGSLVFLTSLGAIILNPMLYKDLPYDPGRDFAPVSLVVSSPTVLVVNPEHTPAKNAAELVALSKAGSRPFSIGSAGIGGTTHISYEMFTAVSGANLLHVPYKGAGPVISDLLAGQIGGFFGDLPGLISNIQSGKLKPLGVLAKKRHPLIPDVATMAEQGFADVESENWYAIVVPAKTPADVIASLNAAVRKALGTESVRSRLLAAGAEILPSTPEEVAALIAADTKRWGRIIQERKITVE